MCADDRVSFFLTYFPMYDSIATMETTLKLYPRPIESRVAEVLADTPVVLIAGPSQAGKTTLARGFAGKHGMHYLSLDSSLMKDETLNTAPAILLVTILVSKVPDNLPTMLGISAGTAAISIGTTGICGSKGAGSLHPELGDFITSGGVFSAERLQFFLWTVIGVFAFVSATLVQDPSTVNELPQIPDSFISLMGLSSLGYLAGKVARKPGPIINQLAPPPPYTAAGTTLRIIGVNLSPRAQVRLNGELLRTGEISVDSKVQTDTQFVAELVLTPTTIAPAASGVAVVKVSNPDGQSAEI